MLATNAVLAGLKMYVAVMGFNAPQWIGVVNSSASRLPDAENPEFITVVEIFAVVLLKNFAMCG